jgi:hypothetical protein
MAKLILAADRIILARELIQKARQLPLPAEFGKNNIAYLAQVKDTLRQARDLVKFIPSMASATVELKAEAKKVLLEADQANQELLH